MARSAAITLAMLFVHAQSGTASRWVPGPAVLPNLSGHAMVHDSQRDAVVVFGGLVGGATATNETWERIGGRWIAGPAAPAGLVARDAHGMAHDSVRERTVLFGGHDELGAQLDDTWEYDGTAWSRVVTGSTPLPRGFHAMAFDARRGVTVLFGGFATGLVKDTWEFDGTAWLQGPDGPAGMPARAEHSMAFDSGRGVTVLFGGSTGATRLDDTWEFDGVAWSPGAPAAGGMVGRSGAGLAYSSSRITLFGGFDGGGELADSWLYDGTSWTAGPQAPPGLAPRARMGFAGTPSRIILFAGRGVSGTLRDVWELLPLQGWFPPAEDVGPTARSGSAMVFDATRGVLVLFGGADATGAQNDTWELAIAWTWAKGPPAPPSLTPRYRHALAFDRVRGRAVLHGGLAPSPQDDTWEYDGTSWTQGPAAPVGLTARSDHAMAFDTVRGVTVLFGGQDSGYRNDTWEYDGASWLLGPSAPALLTERIEHAMAWDASAGAVLLLGGLDPSGPRRDLWSYDGVGWAAQAAPPPMAPRYGHVLVADASSAALLVHGGRDATTILGDTWIRAGGLWRRTSPPDPSPRHGHAAAFDELSGWPVVFSGFDGGYVDDSWVLANGATPIAGEGHAQENGNRVELVWAGLAGSSTFTAYAANAWGVNVAASTTGLADPGEVLTGPGPGAVFGPQVRAFRGDTTPLAKVNFYAYGTLKYGVNVGSGDIESDAYDEILTGAGPGEVFGPHVRAFNVDAGTVSAIAKVNFFAYGTLKYGVNVSSGDVDADGAREILTGAGPGAIFRPQVRGFDYDGAALTAIAKINFDAFATLQYGAQVAGGDVDGDLFGEIGASPGPGGLSSFPARFRGFDYDGIAISQLPGFDITPLTGSYGGRLAFAEQYGIATDDLLCAPGPDPTSDGSGLLFSYDGAALLPFWGGAVDFGSLDFHGANVAAGALFPPYGP